LTDDKDVWWEGMTHELPVHLTDWRGNSWTPDSGREAAHPNGRFTVPAAQCPVIDPAWEDPQGVPISAIIFGGRRSSVVPLVYEAISWAHGVFIGASISSEMTAAAKGEVGKLRHDPFAMLPFCGYHMGDYFGHWLHMGKGDKKLPRIFHVNWFLKDAAGKFLWPGFGDNSRVLKWIFERTDELAPAQTTPIGYLPTEEGLNTFGLKISKDAIHRFLHVDKAEWEKEVAELKAYFSIFGDKLPKGISDELAHLEKRLSRT
jgi:phosphoenolpyruvate carboxykinase (GTP)